MQRALSKSALATIVEVLSVLLILETSYLGLRFKREHAKPSYELGLPWSREGKPICEKCVTDLIFLRLESDPLPFDYCLECRPCGKNYWLTDQSGRTLSYIETKVVLGYKAGRKLRH
jgi:hypothetical protein